MKITSIATYQVNLPLKEGSYNWSGGKSVSVFDSTIVRVETDEGLIGYGEVCPLGPYYLPAYASGARSGIKSIYFASVIYTIYKYIDIRIHTRSYQLYLLI